MNRLDQVRGGALRVMSLVGVLAWTAACSHVNEETLASEMDLLRQEMQAEMQTQDQAVEDRLTERVDTVEETLESRLASLESDLTALRGEFQVTVERLESAIRFNAPIHFAFDDATIPAEGEDLLNHFAQVVSAYYENAVITVEGFTDPSGPAEYNMALGQRRADAVMEYLESAGIPTDRIRAVSYGETSPRQIMPDAEGPGDTGWQNRRVSMVIDFNQPTEGDGGPLAMN